MNLYIARNGETFGPYTEPQVREYVTKGVFLSDELACPEGHQEWSPLSALLHSGSAKPSAPTPPVGNANRSGGSEHVYYQKEGVSVTSARFVVGNQTYVMRNITSVKPFVVAPSVVVPMLLIIIGLFTFAAGFGSEGNGPALLIGAIMVGIGVLFICALKSTHSVVLTTSGGEVRALESKDKKLIDQIVEALNSAIIAYQ